MDATNAINDKKSDSLTRRRLVSNVMTVLTAACAVVAIAILFIILGYIAIQGVTSLSFGFLTNTPQDLTNIKNSGIGNAILGSLLMTGLSCAIGLPIGIAAGVYLAEIGSGWYGKIVRFVADTMTGTPSIIIGIFIYTLVVLPMSQYSGLAGSLALAIIIIPIVARTTEEMIKLVPQPMREGGLALGAAQWRVTWDIVLPAAASGIATGAILAVARVSGETAPLLFTALNNRRYNYFFDQPMASLTVQIYNYAIGSDPTEHQLAWAATLVLMALILTINILVRYLTRKKF